MLPPQLQDILADSASPPFSRSAFIAFLAQNHCLETLEFIMDAERYSAANIRVTQGQADWTREGAEHLCALWRKLMCTYIMPYAPYEVNLPAHARDQLLSVAATITPPHPSELDEAISITFGLMNDSVLEHFIESFSTSYAGRRTK
jgi:hypothetical protein